MTHDEAIDKVAKLLRLAKSDNPHEAALAASRAQEIMDRHKITSIVSEITGQAEPDEPIKDFCADPLEPGIGRLASWKPRLLGAIARANQTRIYLLRSGGMALVGRASDAQTVRYLYGWLKREVDKLTLRDCKGFGHTYANNYRLGVVDTIREKLAAQRKETQAAMQQEASAQPNTFALVLVNNAIAKIEQRAQSVDKWVEANLRLSKGSSSRYTPNSGARDAGRKAGQSISLTRSSGAIGRGTTKQLS